MDEATRAFFRHQQEDPENQVCVDSGSDNPQWASVSHGCFISLESSGVHRSLGVHISFVRSVTMDAWKPKQLKLMELGGNQRLKDFFRQHNIPDAMPIAEKYNTRAAEWYRRNLAALVEDGEPPPPLEEGTGHLLVNEVPSLLGPRGLAEAPAGGPVEENALNGILGPNLGSKVSGGVWSAVGFVGTLANKTKEFAEERVEQAKKEGLIDTVLDTAKQGVGAAVETTTWAAQKTKETTIAFTQEDGVRKVLGKTEEVIKSTAASSISAVGGAVDTVTGQLRGLGKDSAAGLQGMSSGSMQGFGSDAPSPGGGYSSSAAPAPVAPRVPYHLAMCEEADLRRPAQGGEGGGAAAAAEPAPKRGVDLWDDKDWGDWS